MAYDFSNGGYQDFMDSRGQIERAFKAGDYGTVNSLVNQAGYNDQGLAATFGLNPADLNYVRSLGITPVEGAGNPNHYTMWSPPTAAASYGAQAPATAAQPMTASTGVATGGTSFPQNPYLAEVEADISRRSKDALAQGLNSIRSHSIGVGGLGGSRQGVAEGLAISRAADDLTGNLSRLRAEDWNTSGQLALGNRRTDLDAVRLGADLYTAGNQGYLGQGQGLYGVGTTTQQAPWQVLNSASNIYGNYTGYGNTTTNTSQTGGGAQGLLGGALGGAQLAKGWGLGGGGGSTVASPSSFDSWLRYGSGGD